jgi:hypothetical protein
MVMHFMPDPMQPIHSCDADAPTDDDHVDDDDDNDDRKDDWNCSEVRNRACSYDPTTGRKECINTETSTVEWSDGTCRSVVQCSVARRSVVWFA